MALPVPLPADDTGEFDREEHLGRMTFDEFLAFAATVDGSYELVGQMLYARSTATTAHATLAQNIAAGLHAGARRAGCRIYNQGIALRTPRDDAYVPDVMVLCGPPPAHDARYVERPCLVVEVLSPSTRRVDLSEKRLAYEDFPSIQAYWMVEATWRCVYRHWRDAGGRWQNEEITGNAVLPVPCSIAMSLTLDEVYADLEVPHERPRPRLRRVREPDAEYVTEEEIDADPEYAG